VNKKQTFRSTASFGKRQEYTVIARLLKEGMDVYATLVDDQGIDCVIRKDPKTYYDIQIKARSKDCKPYDAGRFAGMTIANPRSNYYFIFYSQQVDKFWVMPSIEVVQFASRNKKGNNIGKFHMLFTGIREGKVYPLPKFQKYENAFYLLK
jgi:hypothetical protein